MNDRNAPCPCGSGLKYKKCCLGKRDSGNKGLAKRYFDKHGIILKTPEQIEGIERSCRLAADILDKLCKMSKEGVTTNEIDAMAAKLTKEAGAIAAPLGYGDPPFPKSICTSLNEVICHGIPNDVPLADGDIMNIDYSCILNGYYGDCSRMVMIGTVSEEKKRVTEAAYECLMNSIAICKPGTKIYEIGDMIEDTAEKYRCSTVYQFVGHGVGLQFHEEPQVYHHRNDPNRAPGNIELAPGMTFTIEPMINIGVPEGVLDRRNHWEARTKDGMPSAQWEHTILITETGHRILTLPPEHKS